MNKLLQGLINKWFYFMNKILSIIPVVWIHSQLNIVLKRHCFVFLLRLLQSYFDILAQLIWWLQITVVCHCSASFLRCLIAQAGHSNAQAKLCVMTCSRHCMIGVPNKSINVFYTQYGVIAEALARISVHC